MGVFDTDGTEATRARTGRLLPGPAHRPEGDHRHLLDGPRAGARRHPLLPVRERGRTPSPTCCTCPGRWRTRTRSPVSTWAAARRSSGATRPSSRARRCCAPTAASSQSLNGRYYTACDVGTYVAGHGRGRPRDPLRDRPQRRARRRRRLLDPDRLGRLPGHAGRGRAHLGQPDAGRPPGRHRRSGQGRQVPGRSPDRGRRLGGRHRRQRGRAGVGPHHVPADRSGRRHPGADHRPTSTCTRRAPSAARSTTTPWPPCAPRSSTGGANNQLAHPGIEKLLEERGILYTPDYVVNAGGVIQVADEIEGFNFERAKLRATGIFETTRRILRLADDEGVPPAVAADRLAERRMAEVGRLRSHLSPLILPGRPGAVVSHDNPRCRRRHRPCTVRATRDA